MRYRIREVRGNDETIYYAEYQSWGSRLGWRPVSGMFGSNVSMEKAVKCIEEHKEKMRPRNTVTIIHKVE